MALKSSAAGHGTPDPLPEAGMAELQAQLESLRADVAALTAMFRAEPHSRAESLRQAAAGAFEELKAQGGDGLAGAEAKAREAMADISDYARKNPLHSLGVAVGLGMILGLLFGRR